jgi:hypothetical protein
MGNLFKLAGTALQSSFKISVKDLQKSVKNHCEQITQQKAAFPLLFLAEVQKGIDIKLPKVLKDIVMAYALDKTSASTALIEERQKSKQIFRLVS